MSVPTTNRKDVLLMRKQEIVKVSAKSNPASVAGAIAALVREKKEIQIQVIGAGALNQAVKAIAIAKEYVAPTGVNLYCSPSFINLEISGRNKTGLCIAIQAVTGASQLSQV
jgi:stage V sporulation protein S